MNTLNYLSQFENDCLNLYEALGSETTDPELKNLYRLLADNRQRHMNGLVAMNKIIHADEDNSVQTERAEQVMNSCRQTLLSADIKKALRNDHDAYNHVIHAEEAMISLCAGMARVEAGEKVKALLDWFVEDEKKFLEEIVGIYDFVEAPHCYLEWGEFSNLRTL